MEAQSISLLCWGSGAGGIVDRWPFGSARPVRTLEDAAAAIDEVVAGGEASWLFFWDSRLGPSPTGAVAGLTEGPADAYHAGLLLGTAGHPDDLDVINPTGYFTVDPPPTIRAVSWRLSLSALLVRTDVIAQLGGLDPAFRSREAAGLDLGWRMLRRGAIPVHEPRLSAEQYAEDFELGVVDRYLLLSRHVSEKWVRYAAARRMLRSRHPVREVQALRTAAKLATASPSPLPPSATYERPPSGVRGTGSPRDADVSVILPTLGRYELVANVLSDLRDQTVSPAEIICVDQTRPHEPGVFEGFSDLPLIVVAQDGLGQWLSRNEAIGRARHDLLLFLDDDSHVPRDFIERHLACLDTYQADISAGASLSVVGAPVPDNYGFYRVADQFDSGNALVRRQLLVRIGAFDRHFDRMRSGDAEFGLRAHLAGAISIHNPDAYRTHYKAAAGGLRAFGSWDLFRQRGFVSPLPLPSVVYFAMRYFTPRQVREHMLIGLVAGVIPHDRKRRATKKDWLRYGGLAVLTAPIQVTRVCRSVAAARRMLAQGPRIPAVEPTGAPLAVR